MGFDWYNSNSVSQDYCTQLNCNGPKTLLLPTIKIRSILQVSLLMKRCNELCKTVHVIRALFNKPFKRQKIMVPIFMARFTGGNQYMGPLAKSCSV